jgi:uncharacterized protein YqeY
MLRETLSEAMKTAMRERDARATATIRMVLAAVKSADIEARPKGVTDGVSDEDIAGIMQKLIKQRRESATMYAQGGRQDLVDQENAEIEVIERFLPKQMDEAQMNAAIDALATELEASSIKDMGRMMAALKTKFAGQMDMAKAGGLVKRRLGG